MGIEESNHEMKPAGAGVRPLQWDYLSFTKAVLILLGIVAIFVIVILLLWVVAQIVLLLFAGILMAVLLRGMSNRLSQRTRLPEGWSLLMVVVLLLLTVGLISWALAPRVLEQFGRLIEKLPEAVEKLAEYLEGTGWGAQLLRSIRSPGDLLERMGGLMQEAKSFFFMTFGVIGSFVLIVFFGLYLAADPDKYTEGIVRLVPISSRKRAGEVLDTLGSILRWWLVGRFIDMFLVGGLTGIGLWALGVPLPLTLAILAGLLTFIPNIGPILAVIPAALLAVAQEPMMGVYVVALYTVIQTVESYLFLPLLQQKTILMPPVLTLFMQIVFGLLFGVLGVVLATPITAAAMAAVKMLYVEDVLGDQMDAQGSARADESEA